MKSYYVSKYLNIIHLTDTYLLFNGFNGCLDEVSEKLGDLLTENGKIASSKDVSKEEIEFLLKRGHITNLTGEQEFDEFKKYVNKLDEYNLKISSNKGSLMLLLSYDCNLACYYCYERPIKNKKANKIMTEEFIDELFNNYYDKLFNQIPRENIDIVLYGGEPLLKRNRKTVEKILHYACKTHNHVGAISNCTQLEYYSDIIGPLPGMINFIQVSFDGYKDNHDKSRIYQNGKGTFDTILKNIHLMLDKKVKVNIRINVESESLKRINCLYELLENEEILNHPYAYVYVHPLHNHFNQTNDSSFLSYEETAAGVENTNFYKNIRHPIMRKAESLAYLIKMKEGTALSQTRFCMQNIPNNYLIDPYGDLYACYEEAGREDLKIGSLLEGDVQFTPLKEQYLERNLINLPECLNCPIALLCGGECGVQARENNKTIFKPFCGTRRSQIYEAIKYIYTEKEKNIIDKSFDLVFPNL